MTGSFKWPLEELLFLTLLLSAVYRLEIVSGIAVIIIFQVFFQLILQTMLYILNFFLHSFKKTDFTFFIFRGRAKPLTTICKNRQERDTNCYMLLFLVLEEPSVAYKCRIYKQQNSGRKKGLKASWLCADTLIKVSPSLWWNAGNHLCTCC